MLTARGGSSSFSPSTTWQWQSWLNEADVRQEARLLTLHLQGGVWSGMCTVWDSGSGMQLWRRAQIFSLKVPDNRGRSCRQAQTPHSIQIRHSPQAAVTFVCTCMTHTGQSTMDTVHPLCIPTPKIHCVGAQCSGGSHSFHMAKGCKVLQPCIEKLDAMQAASAFYADQRRTACWT